MKKNSIYISLFLLLTIVFVGSNAWAANIYVDPTLGANITNGTYSIANRNSSGSDGNAYKTVQAAINAMSGGDDIYLRGGTYTPVALTGSGDNGAVHIPQTKNGSLDNWSSIQSYTGEWAILDGQNVCGPSFNDGAVLGYRDFDKNGADNISYWKFERLEITGGASTDGRAAFGLWLNGGPFIVRYCYIHDNVANTGGSNPGGITGMIMRDSIIEYNYFKNNGSSGKDYELHSTCGPQTHTDYHHYFSEWETSPQHIENAMRKNVIRYNLFDNEKKYAYNGIHNKGRQFLTPKTDVSWTYKEYGDKVHHNIFLGFPVAVGSQQDFQQIYNNIIVTPDGARNTSGVAVTDNSVEGNNVGVVIYNNTIIKGRINHNFGYGAAQYYVVNPYAYIYNNLMDQAPADYDGAAVITLGQPYILNPYTYDSARTDVTNNYIYRSNSTNLKVTRNAGNCYGILSVSAYNACYNATNFSKASSEATDPIYVGTTGADKYISRVAHIVSGNSTISNSGKGGNHPYLSGATIPSYIGATNPDDNNWVAGVLSFENLNNLKNGQQNDPAWVEGNVATPTPDSKLKPPPRIWID